MLGYDLHMHSTASDGIYSTRHLVVMAKAAGIKGIAITDHDTVAGVLDYNQISVEYDFPVIPGLEIGTIWQGREIHILGYCCDMNNCQLLKQLSIRASDRYKKVKLLVNKLINQGYPISMSEVNRLVCGVVGKPHIAQVLVNKGIIPNVDYAFRNIFKNPLYHSDINPHLSPFEAVELIKNADGLCVLAHPGRYRRINSSFVSKLCDYGLDGIEARYSEHSFSDEKYYTDLAYSYNLFITGGSDFHGYEIDSRNILGKHLCSDGEIWQILRKYEMIKNV